MPALFIGHGSPMNALVTNKWTEDWKALGESLPRPRAIVAISAHWYTDGTGVTAVSTPRTIHDFGGFPRALFEVQYPAPGDPELANDLTEILAPTPVLLDSYWGLDHGTWSVLVRMFPKADIPVVQLSIDGTAPPETHRALGERLASLRDKGVLLVGSGRAARELRTARSRRGALRADARPLLPTSLYGRRAPRRRRGDLSDRRPERRRVDARGEAGLAPGEHSYPSSELLCDLLPA